MALIVRKPEGEFELTPQGTFIARCYTVVDLGQQMTKFGSKHKIRMGWELTSELMKDGRPFVVGKDYTASLHPDSGLAQDLTSWRGKAFTDEELAGFDVFKVAGAPCMITVIHNVSGEKTYANVSGVTSVPKGFVVPEAINEKVVFSIDEPDEEMFSKLPEWLQKKVNRTGVIRTTSSGSLSSEPPEFDPRDFPL
jgi:hypothetical protein